MIVRLIAPLVVLAAASSVSHPGATGPQDPLPPRDPAVTRAALEHHVRLLAGEELAGREAATADSLRAADYITRCLEAYGVEAAPGQEGHRLAIPLLYFEQTAVPRMRFGVEGGATVEAVYGADFRVVIRGEGTSTGVLPIRRVDRQNPLPERANPGEALLIVGTPRDRRFWLDERDMGDAEGWGIDLQTLDRAGGAEPSAEPPRPRLVTDIEQEDVSERVYVRGDLRERLLAGDFTSVELTFEEKRTELVDYNVLGVIPGSDPELAHEVVLFFANYDGLGYHRPKSSEYESRLRPGADDNASGCAALLELAEAFAAGPQPKRTLAFLFLTGDKKRRFGLDNYLAKPAIPLGETLTALHVKRLGRPAEGQNGRLWMTGFQRTNLGGELQAAGLPVDPDADTWAKNTMRADSFSFAVQGVVAQSISGSNWNEKDPFTDTADALDLDHLLAVSLELQKAAELLASGELDPAWGEKGPPKMPAGNGR